MRNQLQKKFRNIEVGRRGCCLDVWIYFNICTSTSQYNMSYICTYCTVQYLLWAALDCTLDYSYLTVHVVRYGGI